MFPGAKVFATDMLPELSSACQLADGSFDVPRVTADDYLPRLLEICESAEIGLIVPTIDTELQFLADNRASLEEAGAIPVISSSELIRICRDKRLTTDFFLGNGLGAPEIADPKDPAAYPLFAKPYDGSCSINTHFLPSPADATQAILRDPKLIFQRYHSPQEHDEFTIDMYYDRQDQLRCLVPRQRLETRAGEVSKGRTIWNSALETLRDQLGTIPGGRGCLTVQVFVNRTSGNVFGIEINPRFGGGYPLSHDAGANYPNWLLREYFGGESIAFCDDWERNLTMLRYDDHVLVRGSAS